MFTSRLYPKDEPTILTCYVCKLKFDRKVAFRMYHKTCCSNSCIEVVRKEHQKKSIEVTTPRASAFGIGGPGGFAF